MDAEEFYKSAVSEMLKIAGHEVQFEDLLEEPEGWYYRYTITERQVDEFKTWFIKNIREKLRVSKAMAEIEYYWFMTDYGLKRKEE